MDEAPVSEPEVQDEQPPPDQGGDEEASEAATKTPDQPTQDAGDTTNAVEEPEHTGQGAEEFVDTGKVVEEEPADTTHTDEKPSVKAQQGLPNEKEVVKADRSMELAAVPEVEEEAEELVDTHTTHQEGFPGTKTAGEEMTDQDLEDGSDKRKTIGEETVDKILETVGEGTADDNLEDGSVRRKTMGEETVDRILETVGEGTADDNLEDGSGRRKTIGEETVDGILETVGEGTADDNLEDGSGKRKTMGEETVDRILEAFGEEMAHDNLEDGSGKRKTIGEETVDRILESLSEEAGREKTRGEEIKGHIIESLMEGEEAVWEALAAVKALGEDIVNVIVDRLPEKGAAEEVIGTMIENISIWRDQKLKAGYTEMKLGAIRIPQEETKTGDIMSGPEFGHGRGSRSGRRRCPLEESIASIGSIIIPVGPPEEELCGLRGSDMELLVPDDDGFEELEDEELPYFMSSEVVVHNKPQDLWVSFLGRVYNLSPLVHKHLNERGIRPILEHAGKDISHWFNELTGDIRHFVHPVTGVLVPYTPHGQLLHVGPQVPTSRWMPAPEPPWWADRRYLIGKLTARERPIKIVNTLALTDNMISVQEYKDSLKSKAEDLILKGFPRKIVELNELLETSHFKKELADVHEALNIPIPEPVVLNSHVDGEPPSKKWKREHEGNSDEVVGTRVMALVNGPVPCNKQLSELVSVVKPHIKQLVEDANLLKMWISFMIPKIEDGNNFGVSIQEDTLAEIQSVESEAAAFFDQISRYFVSRGKIVSKVAKYPHIEDYRRAVQELDEKEHLSLWLVMCEVRNRYCTLHDIVIKNLEKIKKPRTSNADSLY